MSKPWKRESSSNNRLSERFDSNSSFAVNWEVQAEQLKYSVKKEVEEGNLIQEALKSLQRSFKYEEDKRSLAKTHGDELQQQIDELEKTAKELKEKIRLYRRAGKLDTDPDSESESEESFIEDDDAQEESHKDEFEFEQFVSELRGDDHPSNHSVVDSNTMTVTQRIKILRDLNAGGMDGERTKKKTSAHYKEHHRRIMKQWIKRENAKRLMFEVTNRFVLTNKHIQFRQQWLENFITSEKQILVAVDVIINTYMKVFLEARILSSEHLKVVFGNIGSFKQLHEQFINAATQIKDAQIDFSCLGSLLSSSQDTFLQFITGRKESQVLVKAAATKKRFQSFMVKTNITATELISSQDAVVAHICNYPSQFIELLEHVNENEYMSIGQGVSDTVTVLTQTNTNFQISASPLPNKLQLLFVQLSFDWLNKEGTFVSDDRQLLAQTTAMIRKPDKTTEKCHFYLFSDAVVISRDYMQKQIFRCFIPLENLMVWDVPPRSNNKEYILEVVDMDKSKKIVVVCDSEQEQEMIVSKAVTATLNKQ